MDNFQTPPTQQDYHPHLEESHLTSDDRTWAMLAHLSALSGLVTGIGFLAGPLIVWLAKKDQSEFIDEHGKESTNFQLSMLLYMVVLGILSAVLFVITLGIAMLVLVPVWFVLGLLPIVFPIIGGLKANDGKPYRYPMTIRFIK